jgi:hypothetical protein
MPPCLARSELNAIGVGWESIIAAKSYIAAFDEYNLGLRHYQRTNFGLFELMIDKATCSGTTVP